MDVLLTVTTKSEDVTDCWFCKSHKTIFDTTITIKDVDDQDFMGIDLCVEHLDAFVTAALVRHKSELADGNDRWYEVPEEGVLWPNT